MLRAFFGAEGIYLPTCELYIIIRTDQLISLTKARTGNHQNLQNLLGFTWVSVTKLAVFALFIKL